jgi:hypothetical protein
MPLSLCRVLPVLLLVASPALGAITQRVVDIPTRPGVTERVLIVSPQKSKAVAVLFPGSDGGMRFEEDGEAEGGKKSLLFRARRFFALNGITAAIVDAPSDRQQAPYLAGFRMSPQHVADIRSVIASLRRETGLPVWLIGTSRGSLSAAFVAIKLAGLPDGPDGVVLVSAILNDQKGETVPEMELQKITVPLLVVHHRSDGCYFCPYEKLPLLMEKATASRRKELLSFEGGTSVGDPCNGLAHHGFNGIEPEVARAISEWMTR